MQILSGGLWRLQEVFVLKLRKLWPFCTASGISYEINVIASSGLQVSGKQTESELLMGWRELKSKYDPLTFRAGSQVIWVYIELCWWTSRLDAAGSSSKAFEHCADCSAGCFWLPGIFASYNPEAAFRGEGKMERKGKRCVCTSNKAGTEGSKFLLCSVIVIGHLN